MPLAGFVLIPSGTTKGIILRSSAVWPEPSAGLRVAVCVCAAQGCPKLHAHTKHVQPQPTPRFFFFPRLVLCRRAVRQRASLEGKMATCVGTAPPWSGAPWTRHQINLCGDGSWQGGRGSESRGLGTRDGVGVGWWGGGQMSLCLLC